MTTRPLFAFRLIACACLGGLGLSGCTETTVTPGPDRTVDQRRKDFPIGHEDFARLGYRMDWVGFPAVTGTLPIQQLEAYPDMVVTLESGSFVSVLEPNTGAQRCADQLANYLTKFVGFVREGKFVHVASEGEIFSLDTQTCSLVGRQRTAHTVSTAPVLYNGLLIFGTATGELLAHVAGGSVGGVKAWGFLGGGAIEHKPVLVGENVGAVSQSGRVMFVEAQTGSLRGLNRIYDGLATDPVTDGRLMFVASLDQSIYAFAPEGATMVWRYRTSAPLRVQPTATADRLYCAVPGQGLTAFETGTSKVLWSTAGFQGTVIGTNKGRLVAWDGTTAAIIDPADGKFIDHVTLPGVAALRPDKFDNGNLYVISKSGVVARFLVK